MRLIDADALKAHYAWWGDTEERRTFDEIVDAQPTVEPQVELITHHRENLVVPYFKTTYTVGEAEKAAVRGDVE